MSAVAVSCAICQCQLQLISAGVLPNASKEVEPGDDATAEPVCSYRLRQLAPPTAVIAQLAGLNTPNVCLKILST